jgi:hypothetical protein
LPNPDENFYNGYILNKYLGFSCEKSHKDCPNNPSCKRSGMGCAARIFKIESIAEIGVAAGITMETGRKLFMFFYTPYLSSGGRSLDVVL